MLGLLGPDSMEYEVSGALLLLLISTSLSLSDANVPSAPSCTSSTCLDSVSAEFAQKSSLHSYRNM